MNKESQPHHNICNVNTPGYESALLNKIHAYRTAVCRHSDKHDTAFNNYSVYDRSHRTQNPHCIPHIPVLTSA